MLDSVFYRPARLPICLSASAAMTGCLTGCEGELSTLAPAGPAAQWVANLWWAMLIGGALLTLLVMSLVALGFRKPSAQPLGLRFWGWGMGVALPLSVLVVLVGAGLWMGELMQAKPRADVLRVEAKARQWAWQFVQPDKDGLSVSTDNLLFIPAGVPVDVVLTSEDVIHSFWVPRLAGKMDVIPGHRNVLRIQANTPGRYEGRSAEFSGVGYGEMRFAVVAYPVGEVPDIAPSTARVASDSPAAITEATP